jgi:hypothetical protein
MSFTRSAVPFTVVIGRAASFPMTWQAPSGAAIDITGFAVTAVFETPGAALAAVVSVTNAAAGKFTVALADTNGIPPGQRTNLAVTITDTTGATFDFAIPIIGELP